MRIAPWNIERPKNAGSARSRRILDKICDIDADIWILTETHDAICPGDNYHPTPLGRSLLGHRSSGRVVATIATAVSGPWPVRRR